MPILARRGRTHEAPLGGASREREAGDQASFFRGRYRRKPISAGGAPGGAGPYVIGLARLAAAGLVTRPCRRRAADRVMVRQGGLANLLAPPGAPFPRFE